jgi:hypothetical protein
VSAQHHEINERLALAWYRHQRILACLLLQQMAMGLPNALWLKITRHYLDLVHPALSMKENEILELQKTMVTAHDIARFHPCAEELRNKRHAGKTKADRIEGAKTRWERTDALFQQRWGVLGSRSIVPKSMRETMQQFGEYRNVAALEHCIENCARLLIKRFNKRGRKLQHLLEVTRQPRMTRQFAESTKLCDLAEYLETAHEGQTFRSILEPHPLWNNIMMLFPRLEAYLSTPYQNNNLNISVIR